jgi:hypothetical protein
LDKYDENIEVYIYTNSRERRYDIDFINKYSKGDDVPYDKDGYYCNLIKDTLYLESHY